MNLTDHNLSALVAALSPAAQRAIALHIGCGKVTAESLEALRRIRASLKRRARARLPAKLKWLG